MSKIKEFLVKVFCMEDDKSTDLSDQQREEIRKANRKLVSMMHHQVPESFSISDAELIKRIGISSWKDYVGFTEGWLAAKGQYSYGLVLRRDVLELI